MTQQSFFRFRQEDCTWTQNPSYRTVLHCDLNNYFASVELLDRPELRNRPVIVGGSTEERHGIVLAKNYIAKKYGIMTGETIHQAMNKCPDLISLDPHYDKYMNFSRIVRGIYQRYTDQIESMGIDECFLDVTGSTYLFGSGPKIADEVRRSVKSETGLTISVGVSFNKVFAKLGSDMKKPDAVTVIPPDRFREITWPLPAYEMLGVGMKTYKKLWYRGIRTIGDIAQCQPELLHSYFGKMGHVLWAYANGLENSPVMTQNEHCPIKSVGHGTTTTADLTDEREVFDIIIELSEEIGMKLRKNHIACGGVALSIRDNDLTTREYQMKLPHSTQLSRDISRAAMKLFHQKHIWRCDIRSVAVRAIYITTETFPEQLDLFTDTARQAELLNLEHTIDHLRERYGEHAVYSGSYLCADKLSWQRIGFRDRTEVY